MSNYLHDFIFHFNAYTGKWNAAHRDHYNDLFNGGDNVISSSQVSTLEALIKKYKGDISKIKSNVK